MSQPYARIFNLSAGPCTLPVPVLEQARDEMLNWNGSGMSVMEMSHRGKHYEAIHQATKDTLKALLGIPDNYRILFLQGGASMENTLIPMNLLGDGTGDYVITGAWGKKSEEAARLLGKKSAKPYDGKAENYKSVPNLESLTYSSDAEYVHITTNETIHGVQFQSDASLSVPQIADASSDILSRPMDVSKYAYIYAGAQKNMGPAGVTLVIMREDLLERVPAGLQPMLDLKLMAENDSLYNTPPTYSIYICGLVYKHYQAMGGLSAIQALNEQKASAIYDAIDGSGGFYVGHAATEARSRMNITFVLPSEELTDAFIKESKSHGLDGLKGHRSVGGCRASIYNAFPLEGCQVLAEFMGDFARRNG